MPNGKAPTPAASPIKPSNSLEPMSPAEFETCLRALRWSNRDLAFELHRGETTIRKMISGSRAIEPQIAAWLRALAWVHMRYEAPRVKGMAA